MKKITYLITFIILIIFIKPLFPREGKGLIPSAVPVNIKPANYNQNYWGFGYNYLQITSEWEDDFVIGDTEKIGEIEYKVHNITISRIKAKADKTILEYDFLVGIVDGKSKTDRYFSDKFSRDFDVDLKSEGYDIGVRILFSENLFNDKGTKNFIDWNYAFSLHAALFFLDTEVSAYSVDGQYGESYIEEEWGIFLRPVLALQPIINISNSFSIIPFVGVGTKLTASNFYWENTGEYIWMGSSQPGQKTDGAGSTSGFAGIEALVGVDIGFVTDEESQHSLTVGGLFSMFFAGEESDFYEVHVIYTIPL